MTRTTAHAAGPGRNLRARVAAEAENRPGVYRFLGPRAEVLYVGKSIRLRTRLLSYFRSSGPAKQRELVRVARGIEWEHIPNEFEALLREFRLIRAFRPRFNNHHRRERRYGWIRLTPGDAPRLTATRTPRPDGSRYFGPFPAPRHLPELLRALSSTVGLRDCPDRTRMRFADQADLFGTGTSPACPRGELGTCPAPCAAGCTVSEYRENVREAADFLSGSSEAPLERLEARIRRAADRMDYEMAARLRDRRERLESLRQTLVGFRNELASLSFVYLVPSDHSGPDRAYVLANGRVLISCDVPAANEAPASDAAAAAPDARGPVRDPDVPWDERTSALIATALRDSRPAPADLDSEVREEVLLVARWFRNRPGERERAIPFDHFLEREP